MVLTIATRGQSGFHTDTERVGVCHPSCYSDPIRRFDSSLEMGNKIDKLLDDTRQRKQIDTSLQSKYFDKLVKPHFWGFIFCNVDSSFYS